LTEAQIKQIHDEQKKTDMKFGELAIKMGFLTENQVEEIITIQKNNHIYLGEALVKKGFVSQKTIDVQPKSLKKNKKT
jgi:hypothetical protein